MAIGLISRLLEKELLPPLLVLSSERRAEALERLRKTVHLPLDANLTEPEFRRRLFFQLHFPADIFDEAWTQELKRVMEVRPQWEAVVREEFQKHPLRLANHSVSGDSSMFAWNFYAGVWGTLLDRNPEGSSGLRTVHELSLQRADAWSSTLTYHAERRQQQARWPEEDLPLFLAFLKDRARIGLHFDDVALVQKARQMFPKHLTAISKAVAGVEFRGGNQIGSYAPPSAYDHQLGLRFNGETWTPEHMAQMEYLLDSKDPALQEIAVRALRRYYGALPKNIFDKLVAASPNLPIAKGTVSDLESLLEQQWDLFGKESGDRWTTLSPEAWEMVRTHSPKEALISLVSKQATWSPAVWATVVHIGDKLQAPDEALALAAKRPANTPAPNAMWTFVNKSLPIPFLTKNPNWPDSTWTAVQDEIQELIQKINEGFRLGRKQDSRAARLFQLIGAVTAQDDIPRATSDILRSRDLAQIAKQLDPNFLGLAKYRENVTPRSWIAECRRKAARFAAEMFSKKLDVPVARP